MSVFRQFLDRFSGATRRGDDGALTPPPPPPPGPESVSQKLRRLAQWCTTGRLAAAELELHEWHRHADCPAAACVLLASLMARRGGAEDACRVLHRYDRVHASDADVSRLLVCTLVTLELSEAATRLVHQLHQKHGHDMSIERWLEVMQAPGVNELPTHAEAQVRDLAMELQRKPDVLPTLLAAQKIQTTGNDLSLLRQAVERAARGWLADDHRMTEACRTLAELAVLAGDADDARRWAHRGLRINPYNSSLALVLSKITDDIAVGPPAATVLQGAVAANPRYHDLRIALVRRLFTQGAADAARAQLEDWIADDPANPHAHKLAKEIAA
ncbi:MAG: hypothetical protein K8S99_05035 [Planctomycetes bacterium]|nr:hypothetical protein [Planctomycetota bacterium]